MDEHKKDRIKNIVIICLSLLLLIQGIAIYSLKYQYEQDKLVRVCKTDGIVSSYIKDSENYLHFFVESDNIIIEFYELDYIEIYATENDCDKFVRGQYFGEIEVVSEIRKNMDMDKTLMPANRVHLKSDDVGDVHFYMMYLGHNL